jgi:hypothetical protein
MAVHPLVCDGKGRPQGWSWSRGAAPLLPPTLDPDTALALTLLAHHLASALPPRTLERRHLTPNTFAINGASTITCGAMAW